MKRGFTLIELLIVIAIISILASVVITAVTEARRRAADAKVKAQITQGKAAADIYFASNGSYGNPNVSLASNGAGCTGSMFTDAPSNMLYLSNSSVYPGGTSLVCIQYVQNFAFAGLLSNGEYWCVDSSTGPKAITISNPASIVASDDNCDKLDSK